MTQVISLDQVLASGRSTVLSGRADGAYARERFGLERLEDIGERVVIMVPERVKEMTPSFVLGLFSATLKKLAGETPSFPDLSKKFFDLYEFKGSKNARRDVEMAITDYVDVEMSLSGLASLASEGKAQ